MQILIVFIVIALVQLIQLNAFTIISTTPNNLFIKSRSILKLTYENFEKSIFLKQSNLSESTSLEFQLITPDFHRMESDLKYVLDKVIEWKNLLLVNETEKVFRQFYSTSNPSRIKCRIANWRA
jgi:hypothetical protein